MFDESLHGYFFRRSMVKNEDTLDLIISSMGSFKVHVPDVDISMMRDISINNKSWKSMCVNSGYSCGYRAPNEDNDNIRKPLMFRPDIGRGVQKSIRVKFCAYCIEESIIENGFGYHKAAWLKNESTCNIHLQPLKVIASTTKATTRELLYKVLSGFLLPNETTPYLESSYDYSVLDIRLKSMFSAQWDTLVLRSVR
ncbi:hypothetical protein [Vibrio coralliilyticus]|uniref:hypothetical protein n=1 Tax=Vibrio coralliilyticus TaxID=190893 RepID=UPI00148DC545|nr:hypothetical protein [Vibrio coralliilyticus]NOI31052.1 hypothetical protein [Vibrio coralliilyticus]NOI50272.1 hypothetical protein [Vibrio coralliilyticus]